MASIEPSHRHAIATRGAKRAKRSPNKTGAQRKKTSSRRSSSNRTNIALAQFRPIITLFVAAAFVYALYLLARVDAQQTDNAELSNPPSVSGDLSVSQDEYTFYQRLRDFSVTVDATPNLDVRSETNTLYLIQTGSFKTRERAERQKAELALLGLEPEIKDHINSNGNRWYRVTVGPFSSRSKMASARNAIISNGLEASVFKRKL